MPRRVSLPSADDLFRLTEDAVDTAPAAPGGATAKPRSVRAVPDDDTEPDPKQRRPSGRVRHDEKMTVYVTAGELLSIEHTRLTLRASHGLAVDRGRLVREALALVLAEYDANGADSALVRRLAQG